jgi:hypothetical protein
MVGKKSLKMEELESQTALVLPDRETLDSLICVGGCEGKLVVNANVCVNAAVTAAVSALSSALTAATGLPTTLECQPDNRS